METKKKCRLMVRTMVQTYDNKTHLQFKIDNSYRYYISIIKTHYSLI